ncbi:MAG: restriction endonuclease subunit S [Ardenticatenaceae bacterium]|nr:restriction endonuclease subunit S [Ardenticatenaceae bacterium]
MRIADILDTVDAAIQQTGQLIAKLKQVKAGLLHDLLTRGLDEHGNLRDPEVHPEQFKVVDGYGRVPKDWEFVQIKDIAVQVTDGDHHTPQRSESGILLLSARNVLNGVLDLTDVDYVPKSEYLRMIKRCHPEAGDILISCSGTVGRVCAVPEGLRFALVRSVALIKFYDSRINSRYAEWVLRSNIVQSQIIASQRQAAQPNLFQGPIKDLFLPLPSILEQQTIVEILDGNESRIRAEEAYRDKLQAIKQGLMHDLLTGKVRV